MHFSQHAEKCILYLVRDSPFLVWDLSWKLSWTEIKSEPIASEQQKEDLFCCLYEVNWDWPTYWGAWGWDSVSSSFLLPNSASRFFPGWFTERMAASCHPRCRKSCLRRSDFTVSPPPPSCIVAGWSGVGGGGVRLEHAPPVSASLLILSSGDRNDLEVQESHVTSRRVM